MIDFSSKTEIALVIIIIALIFLLLHIHKKSAVASTETPSEIGIQRLIERVKTELVETSKNSIENNEAPLLILKEFQLEINFVVKETVSQDGHLDFEVVTVGNKSDYGIEKTQKITIKMESIAPIEQVVPADGAISTTAEPPNKKK